MTDTVRHHAPAERGRRDFVPVAGLLGLASVVLVVVATLESVRVLFTVGYRTAEKVGWIPGGLLVVATFVAPGLTPAWRRLTGRASLPLATGLLIVLRVGEQGAGAIPYWLAALAVVFALIVLTELMARTEAFAWGLGVVVGLAVDTALRALGATWDIPWRGGFYAWTATAILCAGIAVCALLLLQRVRDPNASSGVSVTAAVLVGPLLYLTAFYTQSPAFLASSAHISLAAAVAVALADALVAACALAVGVTRRGPADAAGGRSWSVWMSLAAGALLAVMGWLLPVATGAAVIVLVVAVQAAAAWSYGSALREPPATAFRSLAFGLATGTLALGALALVYQVGFLVKIPIPGRLVPALAGACFVLAARAPAPGRVTVPDLRPTGALLTALAVLVPLWLVATAPNLATPSTPNGPVKVMTFNINQAVRGGQLGLTEIARLVDAARPDVVVLEEVGRGMAVSGMTDEAEWLHRELRLPYVWAPAGDNQFGNVVLSRLPVLAHNVLALGKGSGTQKRSAAFVRLGTGNGTDLLVIGAHLQNGSGASLHATRAQEIDAILSRWQSRGRTVLLGDLNIYPGWQELGLVTGAGFRTPQDTVGCTMPTSNQNCPDWVFVSNDLGLSSVQVTVDRPDHRPVIGTVTIPSGS